MKEYHDINEWLERVHAQGLVVKAFPENEKCLENGLRVAQCHRPSDPTQTALGSFLSYEERRDFGLIIDLH